MTNETRWAWARLNADTLFLGLLLAAAGLFALIAPGDEVTAARESAGDGRAHYPLFYVLAASYLIAGLLLVVGLIRGSLRIEVVARSLLVAGIILNVWRHIVWVGPGVSTWSQLALLAIVLVTSALRLSVLLNKAGLIITRPPVDEGDR